LWEVATAFARLGCLSFGGPIAHLGYFRAELVDKRKWLDDSHYADIVALCQFLPGPASSQVVFALGMLRAGLAGALIASLCFTLPSALLMIGFAYGVAGSSDLQHAGWLHGLKLAAVAVVAQAVWGMGKKLCTDRVRVSLCVGTAALLLVWPVAIAQLAAISLGALVGLRVYRSRTASIAGEASQHAIHGRTLGSAVLLLFGALLLGLPALAAVSGARWLAEFDSFYRSGSLVFGGGHVVLPLLRAEVVPRGWVTDDQFLAGYAAAQALPGPLFTFAAYLGAVMGDGRGSWQNGLLCLFAIFLPAWLLIGGALPFWKQLRERPWAQAALAGANASVVGVLLAAFYSPVLTQSAHTPVDAAVALVAFGVLEHWKAPAWLVVAGMASVGQWLLPS
jgi:chromate transporter